MKNYAIILAAGLGTRMKSELPKCAFKLLGKPMVEYLVDAIEEIEIDEVITVVGHKREVIKDILKNRSNYAVQEQQLGTADAVKSAVDFIKDDGYTIILLGDAPLVDAQMLNGIVSTHKNNKNDLTIGTFNLDNPTGYGRIVKENDKIVRITEQKDATELELQIKEVNSGLLCVDNKLLKETIFKIENNNSKGEYYLTDLVAILATNNYKIGTFTISEIYKLMGINDLYTLSIVEKYLREDINKKHMLNGVNIINPETVTISSQTIIENGTIIQPGSVLFGKNRIGKNCNIGPNSTLINVELEENVICNNSYLINSKVGSNTQIGPFAHIRENTIIGDNNRIGNFVEVKNSTTNTNTKAAHLTYIGDAETGKNVNFGCGSITVNYDGVKKSKTVIGDNVFIGSNANIIAPIKIGDNSFIAAGSTVHKEVEEYDLVIARAPQINKKGYIKKGK